MPEIVDFDEPPVVVAPMYLPIPVLDHLPPPVARRLTVPPSPLGMPPRVSERPPRPPRRISPLGILAAFGGLVLLAMVGVTTMIATRADPVPIPEPHAAITEPESLTAILDTRTEVPPMETTGDDSEHTAAATARRAHARSAPGTAASRAPAAAAAGRDGTVAAAPSHEQVAMAARTIRGAVLMCGMSMAVTGPGTCELNLTFDSSGHVANVAVAPPYAGTTFGSCAMRAARRMSVPPFSQPTFRATQSFQVR